MSYYYYFLTRGGIWLCTLLKLFMYVDLKVLIVSISWFERCWVWILPTLLVEAYHTWFFNYDLSLSYVLQVSYRNAVYSIRTKAIADFIITKKKKIIIKISIAFFNKEKRNEVVDSQLHFLHSCAFSSTNLFLNMPILELSYKINFMYNWILMISIFSLSYNMLYQLVRCAIGIYLNPNMN